MSKVIKLRKGLDIPLLGGAERVLTHTPMAASYALTPGDYRGVVPKLLVKEGDRVRAGSPVFFDKQQPQVLFTSPVSGVVGEVVRGEKRKILSVTIVPDMELEQQSERFAVKPICELGREGVKEILLRTGFWPMLVQRPYGIIARTEGRPKAIFVSGLDTAPLAPDLSYLMRGQGEQLVAGLEVLGMLTQGRVHVTVGDDATGGGMTDRMEGMLSGVDRVEVHRIRGPHPAGNVGTQIAHIDPINKGEVVWTVDLQHVAMIGRLFLSGVVDMSKTVAVTGGGIQRPRYHKIISGAQVKSLVQDDLRDPGRVRLGGGSWRFITGDPLTGRGLEEGKYGYLGFYHNQISVVAQGDRFEFFGWALPRLGKFSISKSYFSWLRPGKRYNLDTNLNGGERAFVLSGIYERVMPMDIYPVYLMKAILAGDVEQMENLGIYEVIEQDVALCEFIDPSKIEWQDILSRGIDLMIKELGV